jgi:GAF domain-containing protein
LRETLALGCEYLKLSTGIISKNEGDNIYVSVLQSALETLHEGQLFPKNQTYSDLLKVDEGVVCIEHIAQSKYSDHPSYQRFRQETYIGIPLFLEGHRYGTLGFSDDHPRATAYSEVEIEFINVLGDWVNSTLKRLALDHALELQQKLNDAVARAQSQFIKGRDKREGIRTLLNDIVLLTGSRYGQVCKVQQGKTGDYILKNYVSAEVSENADRTTSGDDKNDFTMEAATHSLDAQFAQVLSTGQAISGNALSGALHRFLCVPVYYNGDIVATIGLANSSNDYDQQTIDFLQPVLITIGQLINAAKVQRQHEEGERRLANIIEGTNIGTWECDIASGETVYNERWAEMLGYTLAELQPTTVQTWLDMCHPEDLKRSTAMLEKHFKESCPTSIWSAACVIRTGTGYGSETEGAWSVGAKMENHLLCLVAIRMSRKSDWRKKNWRMLMHSWSNRTRQHA